MTRCSTTTPRWSRPSRRRPRSRSTTSASTRRPRPAHRAARFARADRRRGRRRTPAARAQPPRRRAAAAGRPQPALSMLQRRSSDDPALAEQLAAAGDEVAQSLEELRELARGIHPAVLNYGLGPALESLASRSVVPTRSRARTLMGSASRSRWPHSLRRLRGAREHRQVRAGDPAACAVLPRRHRGDRDRRRRHRRRGRPAESGLAGSRTGWRARRYLRVTSPPGAGTVVTAEIP